MSLPYYAEFGWEPTILCIEPNFIEGIYDPTLSMTVPESIEVIKSPAISQKLSRKFALGNLAFRSIFFLIKETAKYFEKNSFDVVYFSTTVFLTMTLGRYWFAKYKVPYVLDFQDPWLRDDYARTTTAPPGGKLKYAIVQSLAQVLEPFTLRQASHITSVSPEYPKILMQRYAWLKADRFTILPFGAPERDFEILPNLNIQQKIFDPKDGYQHWVYVGRGGDDMAFSLNSLFLAIQKLRQQSPELWRTIKIHFVGTKYSIFDRDKPIEAIAASYDLNGLVAEYPQRIPYFEALQILKDSHAILIIGSDEPSYSPSKVYPCVLARKPLLAILHRQSLVVDVLERCKAGQTVTFDDRTVDLLESLIAKLEWLRSQAQSYIPNTDWEAFQPYTAREMTKKQCAIFDRCISPSL
ncbi:Glycosyltransferase subfamily 4-like N-terminal domain-containing protein [Tumidithrix helvetica PCC 7403]